MEAGAAPLRAHTCRSENPASDALTRVAALELGEGALAVPCIPREGGVPDGYASLCFVLGRG